MPHVITDACFDVSGLGSPGSAEGNASELDHPFVTAMPLRQR